MVRAFFSVFVALYVVEILLLFTLVVEIIRQKKFFLQ